MRTREAAARLHDAPCDSTFPGSTLQIVNGVFAFSFVPAPGVGDGHQRWSYATSGSQVTLTLQCDSDPNGLVGTTVTTGYTAGGTELTLFYPSCCGDSYVGENVTFTRQ